MSLDTRKYSLRNIGIKIWLLLVLFTLLVSASYTWFSISRTPMVSDMQISVDSTYGMELSRNWRSDDWTLHLDVRDMVDEKIEPLKPATWVDSKQMFVAPDYGVDGRMTGFTKELTDEKNANQLTDEGYYMKLSFYARTGTACTVSLAEAVTSGDGKDGAGTYVIGTPAWKYVSVIHYNEGNGAQYALRVGFKITKLDLNGNEKANSMQFYIYEPNYDGHVDESIETKETPSIDGAESLVPEYRMIRQTTSTWTEAYPNERNVVIKDLGKFVSDTTLFELMPDEYAKIEVYFWLEGQDQDISYISGANARLMANIQFKADSESQSGLEEFR